jgi:hypothetical protein
MLEILTEKPLTIGLAGGLVFAVLLIIGLRRGQSKILTAAAVIFALTCALVLIERMIVTKREHVKHSLHEMESAINRDDLETLLTYVHSSASGIRDRAQYYYDHYEVRRANITRKEFVVLSKDEVLAKFIVMLTGGARGSGIDRGPVYVEANFKKEDDVWKVVSYKIGSIDAAFSNKGLSDDGGAIPLEY